MFSLYLNLTTTHNRIDNSLQWYCKWVARGISTSTRSHQSILIFSTLQTNLFSLRKKEGLSPTVLDTFNLYNNFLSGTSCPEDDVKMTATQTFSLKDGNQTCVLLSGALRFSIPYTSRQNSVRPAFLHSIYLPPTQCKARFDCIGWGNSYQVVSIIHFEFTE